MREIKFRAWKKPVYFKNGKLKIKGELSESFNPFNDATTSIDDCWIAWTDEGDWNKWTMGDDYILMQYTGLKDRIGYEIYEGDIVELYPLGRLKKGLLVIKSGYEWGETGFIAESIELVPDICDEKKLIKTVDVINKRYTVDYKVIGNIYENPELLRK